MSSTTATGRGLCRWLAVGAVGLSIASGLASAAPPTIDGVVDPVYPQAGITLDFVDSQGRPSATLHFLDDTSIDPNFIYLAIVVTKKFSDSSYGLNRHSSWPGGHSFFDLAESDVQRLQLYNACDEIVVDAVMDFIDGVLGGGSPYGTPSTYDVDMDATESIKIFINGGDWSDLAYQTSLAGSLNNYGYCSFGDCSILGTDLLFDSPPWADEPNYVPAAPYGDFIYEHIYEVRIDRTIFSTAGCVQGTPRPVLTQLIELHSSPSKVVESPIEVMREPAFIGGRVWFDADRDVVRDVGEPGIGSVALTLHSDPNGDGDPADGSVVARTVSDLSGRYGFSRLGAGSYVVEVEATNAPLAGLVLSAGVSNPSPSIVLAIGDERRDIDFPYQGSNAAAAVIGDTVWSDADGDGLRDAGEPGIGGVTLDLLRDTDGDTVFETIAATATTAVDGVYRFVDVAAGEYRVDVTDTGGVLAGYTLSAGPHGGSDPSIAVAAAAGEAILGLDFGYLKAGLGSIGNQVWWDKDEDGEFNDSTSGVGRASVVLIADADGDGAWDVGERIVATTETASNGVYAFDGLALDDGDGDADYLVSVADANGDLGHMVRSLGAPAGADNRGQLAPYAVALSSGSPTNVTADFGFDPGLSVYGRLAGRLWFDLDGDGLRGANEPGAEDVTMHVYNDRNKNGAIDPAFDEVIGVQETDALGRYLFDRLDHDTNGEGYILVVTNDNGALDNHTPTADPDGVLDNQADDIISTAAPHTYGLDFGYRMSGTFVIGDTVFDDADGDGAQDGGEPGIADVFLDLYDDANGNGARDEEEHVLAATRTDTGGAYVFSNLVAGDYIVVVTDDRGRLADTVQTLGAREDAVTIGAVSDYDVDFGFVRPLPATIGNFVWEDSDGDGVQDGGEPGLANVSVTIVDPGGDGVPGGGDDALVATEVTDATGAWSATVPHGLYYLELVLPAAYRPTIADQGSDSLDSDFSPSTARTPVTLLAAGESDLSWAAGLYRGIAVGNRLWFDLDDDGVEDPGEPGIGSAVLRLMDPGGDGLPGGGDDAEVAWTTSDPRGHYIFRDHRPGAYFVDVDDATLPAGLAPAPGTADPSAVTTQLTGEAVLYLDFGFASTASATVVVGDRVWSDADNDGVQDPGEPGIAGVTIDLVRPGPDALFGTADDISSTATTAADGGYRFVGVAPGRHRVDVTDTGGKLAGYALTSGAQSSTDPTASNFRGAGEKWLRADFGYNKSGLGSVGGHVWADHDGDGFRDADEPGIGGVSVALFLDVDADGALDLGEPIVAVVETATDGAYSFAGLELDDGGGDGDADYLALVTDVHNRLAARRGTTGAAGVDDNSQAQPYAVALSGGAPADATADFGYSPAGTIGGVIWSDANGDGGRADPEVGVGGAAVTLFGPGPDTVIGTGDDVVLAATSTAADGRYRFQPLQPGDFRVVVDAASPPLQFYVQTGDPDEAGLCSTCDAESTRTLTVGEGDLGANFGWWNPALADISAVVYADTDGDGEQDGGESGLEGAVVELWVDADGDGFIDPTTESRRHASSTDASGQVVFADLEDDDYVLRLVHSEVVTDYRLTGPGRDQAVELLSADESREFPLVRRSSTAAIGAVARINHDDWADCRVSSDVGLGGVEIALWRDDDRDGILNTGLDGFVAVLGTDADGAVLFSGLPAGDYFLLPDTATNSLPPNLSRTDAPGHDPALVYIADGEVTAIPDFAYRADPGLWAVGGRLWSDVDGNGVLDSGERGIGGVRVSVDAACGGEQAWTRPDGSFWLTGTPGDCVISVDTATLPAGLDPGPTLGGTCGAEFYFSALAGDAVSKVFFGFLSGTAWDGSIGDTVWFDRDGDGVADADEPGIAGVTVDLLDASTNVVATMETGAGGQYDFLGLPAGSYFVRVSDRARRLARLDLATGGNPAGPINLSSGQDYDAADFPYRPVRGVIGNFVWHDLDADGVAEADEPGIEGVTVDLWIDLDGDSLATPGVDNWLRRATSDRFGEYWFGALLADDYVVDVGDVAGVLAGFVKTSGTPGVDDNSQSDPYALTLSSFDPDDWTADFGYRADVGPGVASVSGSVYFDDDNDGAKDGGEGPIYGVELTLYRDLDADQALGADDPEFGRVLSSPGGSYTFTDLPKSDFLVVPSYGAGVHGRVQSPDPGVVCALSVDLSGGDVVDQDIGYFAEPVITDCVDVAIDKNASPMTIGGDSNVTYTLVVTNRLSYGAGGVTVTDSLPAGVTFVSSVPAPTSQLGNDQIYFLGTLAAQAGSTITIAAIVNPAGVGWLTNVATVASSGFELDAADNVDDAAIEALDFDGDGSADTHDLDDDNDGMSDGYETRYNLNPTNAADAPSTPTRMASST